MALYNIYHVVCIIHVAVYDMCIIMQWMWYTVVVIIEPFLSSDNADPWSNVFQLWPFHRFSCMVLDYKYYPIIRSEGLEGDLVTIFSTFTNHTGALSLILHTHVAMRITYGTYVTCSVWNVVFHKMLHVATCIIYCELHSILHHVLIDSYIANGPCRSTHFHGWFRLSNWPEYFAYSLNFSWTAKVTGT